MSLQFCYISAFKVDPLYSIEKLCHTLQGLKARFYGGALCYQRLVGQFITIEWRSQPPRVVPRGIPDPYTEKLLDTNPKSYIPQAQSKGKGLKKLRKMRRSVNLTVKRQRDQGGFYEDKWLPPGHMKDLWTQYKAKQGNGKAASFPAFWRAPC